MIVSFIIPNYNGEKYIDNCIHSIYNQNLKEIRGLEGIEVIVVDNASEDDSILIAKKNYENIKVILNRKNTGVAAAYNKGIEYAKGEYAALVHVDTVLDENWLKNSLDVFDDNHEGKYRILASASLVIKNDGTKTLDCRGLGFSSSGYVYKIGGGKSISNIGKRTVVPAPYNAAALYRKEVIRILGGFDESFFNYLEDADLGIRGYLQGFSTIYNPDAIAYHSGFTLSGGRECDFTVRFKSRNNLYIRYKNLTPMQRFGNKIYLSNGVKRLKRYYKRRGLNENVEQGIHEAQCSKKRCKKEYKNSRLRCRISFKNRMFKSLFTKKNVL